MTKDTSSRVLSAVAVSGLMIVALALAACSPQTSAGSQTGASAPKQVAPAAPAPAPAAVPAAAPPAAPAAAAPAGPDAQSVIQAKCTGGCHQAQKVLAYRAGSATQARSVVSSMTKKGGLTPAAAQAIVAYYAN